MEKQDVIEFFDRCAPGWDADMVKSDEIIGMILDNAEVGPGMDVLDVACGTGVMFPYYLQRDAASVTAIDISPEMAKIAAAKTADEPRITVVCGDVEEVSFEKKFDRIVVYNAFPHFPDPRRLIRILASLLKDGGRLTVAHGASRETIDGHHRGAASKVSNGLMTARELEKIFDKHLEVDIMISNSRMYQVSGVKRGTPEHSHTGTAHAHSRSGEAHASVSAADTASLEELLVLMRYLVSHNDTHAQEVADLAQNLLSAGKNSAYNEIMDAVSDFDQVNAKLDAILCSLSAED